MWHMRSTIHREETDGDVIQHNFTSFDLHTKDAKSCFLQYRYAISCWFYSIGFFCTFREKAEIFIRVRKLLFDVWQIGEDSKSRENVKLVEKTYIKWCLVLRRQIRPLMRLRATMDLQKESNVNPGREHEDVHTEIYAKQIAQQVKFTNFIYIFLLLWRNFVQEYLLFVF